MSEHRWNLHRTTKDCRKDKYHQDFGEQNLILKSFISNLDRSRCYWIYLGCRLGLMSCDGCSVYLQSPGNISWRKPVWQRNRKLFLQTSGDRAGLRPVCGEDNTQITLHLSYNQIAVLRGGELTPERHVLKQNGGVSVGDIGDWRMCNWAYCWVCRMNTGDSVTTWTAADRATAIWEEPSTTGESILIHPHQLLTLEKRKDGRVFS